MNYKPNETEHTHDRSHVVDPVVLFKVDPITRQITKVSDDDIVLVKNDHNSERYRISLPRYIDGHDMSLCDIARVHYINTGASSGVESSDVYESDDLSLIIEEGMSEDDATEISFTWLVANTATQEYGRLAFAIELSCSSENVADGYAWHSGVYSNISVSDGIHNGRAIVGVYGDILQSWWEKITAAMGGSIEENSKEPFRFWIGTQEEYDAIKPEDIIANCLYYISDDKTFDEIEKKVNEVHAHLTNKENPHSVTAAQVGAYTQEETDSKVSTVETNAKSYADSVAATAESNAKSYADGKASAAESNAKSYADTVAATAETNATEKAAEYTEERLGDIGTGTVKAYADTVASTAESNAKTYADTVAGTAESNAKTYADTVAGTAESNAKAYVKEFADTAADSAESNAKSYADTVAAEKAAAAITSATETAVAYTDSMLEGYYSKSETDNKVSTHTNKKDNPHGVTASQVGAYSKTETDSAIATHANKKDNPHGVTAAQVGAYTKSETYSKTEIGNNFCTKRTLVASGDYVYQRTSDDLTLYVYTFRANMSINDWYELEIGNYMFTFKPSEDKELQFLPIGELNCVYLKCYLTDKRLRISIKGALMELVSDGILSSDKASITLNTKLYKKGG